MQKDRKLPLWVLLALSNIETRKGALILIWISLLFSLYCIPWSLFYVDTPWISQLFLIDNWEWFAMMMPMTLWYWLSMKWMDKNKGWRPEPAIRESN